MAQVEMTDGEWQAVLGILSSAPWRDANPLMMKIGAQIQAQQAATMVRQMERAPGNSKEEVHG